MLLINITNVWAHAENNENDILNISILTPEIPNEAVNYVYEAAPELIGNILVIADLFEITVEEPEAFFIGTPFTIINTNEAELSTIDVYYFPVIENAEIKLIMQVFFSNGEWHNSISKDFSEQLNALNIIENETPFVIFCEGNNYYAKNAKETVAISSYKNLEQASEKEVSFCELSYNEIINVIADKNISISEINIIDSTLQIGNTIKSILQQSSISKNTRNTIPGFSMYTDTYKVFEVANCLLNQDTSQICWAACLGTAYRYRTGNRTVTSTSIANTFNYWQGASIQQVASFANNLNLGGSGNTYRDLNTSVSPFFVQHNINNRFPIFMGCANSNGGHMLLGIGYLMTGNKMQVIFWDPDADHTGGIKSTDTFSTGETSPIAYYYGPIIYKWTHTALLVP